MFEPLTSMERAVEKFGKTHVIASSKVDCRTLTFGTKEDIKAEVDASLKLGLPCPGWIAVVGNHIAPNVPIENALFYIDYLTTHWKR
jgi:uroporphyrinogen-III decarboxylase